MLNKIIGIVGGSIGIGAAVTGHANVAGLCVLLLFGVYFAARFRVAR